MCCCTDVSQGLASLLVVCRILCRILGRTTGRYSGRLPSVSRQSFAHRCRSRPVLGTVIYSCLLLLLDA